MEHSDIWISFLWLGIYKLQYKLLNMWTGPEQGHIVMSFCAWLQLWLLLLVFVWQTQLLPVFTALHEMQARSSDENSVCPSIRLSVRHTRDPWQNGRKIGPDFYTIRKNIYLVFWEKEWLVGSDPFYVKFWVNRPPLERNRRFSTNNRL